MGGTMIGKQRNGSFFPFLFSFLSFCAYGSEQQRLECMWLSTDRKKTIEREQRRGGDVEVEEGRGKAKGDRSKEEQRFMGRWTECAHHTDRKR